MQKKKILVLMGGGGTEHEVSLSSGKEVVKNLNKDKYEVVSMVIENKKIEINEIKKINPDVVFLIIHGTIGEDGTTQKILEEAKIKFIGCGSKASAIGMDKVKFKKLMKKNNLLVPNGLKIIKGRTINVEKLEKLGKKLVVKPSKQGSSVGVSLVDDFLKLEEAMNLAFKYDKKIIIEEFVEGIEVSCGVLEENKIEALPVIEICPKNNFFDYESKYKIGKCEEIVPARLSDKVTKKVQKISLKVFKLIKGRGFARIDFIINKDKPIILEINTIPGLTPNSLFPKEAAAIGIDYSELLDRMVKSALKK